MKNLLKVLVCLIALTMSSQRMMATDWFPIAEVNNHHYSFSIGGGAVLFPEINCGAVDFNFTIWGGHINLLFMGTSHEGDTGVDKWDDKQCFAIHGGYQIPIVSSFSVIPLVGFAMVEDGYTDGSNYHTNNSGIHNSFYATGKVKEFDYGGSLVYTYKLLSVSAAYTLHSAYGSIGLRF
jgi:hypothetical protein